MSAVNSQGDTSFASFETKRLLIRRFQQVDLAPFAAYRSLPEVAKYQGWSTPYTMDEAQKFLKEMNELDPAIPGKWFQFAITLKDSKVLVGDCGLKVQLGDSRQAEIGFTLDAKHQGKGYGAEAIEELLKYIFETLKKHRVTATTDALNLPSIKLLERVGFRKEGHYLQNIFFKGAWGDECAFAMLAREYQSKSKLRAMDLGVKG